MGSCWFSQLWPSQQSCLDTLNLLWTSYFWWRITCMGLMEHMDGTQCEEVHLLYMERMGAFVTYAFDLITWSCMFRLGFLLLFRRVAVLFSTGCSRAGIPPLPLRGLLGEIYIVFIHIQAWGQAPFFILSIISIAEYCCVAGCCSGGLITPLPGLFLSRRCLPSLERSARKIFGLISHLGTWPKYSSSPTMKFLVGIASFFINLQ